MVVKYYTDPRKIPDRPERFCYTVVLDVDETLVHRDTDGVIHVRPYAREMISRFLSLGDLEVLIWSAGKEIHVSACLEELGIDNVIAIVRGDGREWDIKDMKLICNDKRTFKTIFMVDDRNDTITAAIHFHVNEWRNDDHEDYELLEVRDQIVAYAWVQATQGRCSTLSDLAVRNSVASNGIFG